LQVALLILNLFARIRLTTIRLIESDVTSQTESLTLDWPWRLFKHLASFQIRQRVRMRTPKAKVGVACVRSVARER
jgi:hypothetical protein